MSVILIRREIFYSMKLLSSSNIFLKMGKLIEFSETIARAGAFLPTGISHAKRIIFDFRELY